jgi:hypothetical protein
MHSVNFNIKLSITILALGASACSRYYPITSETSPVGVTAYLSRDDPPATNGYSYTVCLSSYQIQTCPKSVAILAVYRPEKISIKWKSANVLEIHNRLGEIFKTNSKKNVLLKNGKTVTVKIDLINE